MMNLMIDLLYEKFEAQTQASTMTITIPDTIPNNLHVAINQVWISVIALKPVNMGILTPRSMAADPGMLIPIYIDIIRTYNAYNDEEHDPPLKSYNFSILPTPSTHRRFIALLPENIKARTGYQEVIRERDGPTFLKSYQIFYDVFQFRKFGFER